MLKHTSDIPNTFIDFDPSHRPVLEIFLILLLTIPDIVDIFIDIPDISAIFKYIYIQYKPGILIRCDTFTYVFYRYSLYFYHYS